MRHLPRHLPKHLPRHLRVLSLTLMIVAASACSTQQFTFGDRERGSLRYLGDQAFINGGAWQVYDINAADLCDGAQRVGMVSYTYSFSNIITALATFGIYTPRYAEVYCR